jgi:polysaccharide export outer membrane protein
MLALAAGGCMRTTAPYATSPGAAPPQTGVVGLLASSRTQPQPVPAASYAAVAPQGAATPQTGLVGLLASSRRQPQPVPAASYAAIAPQGAAAQRADLDSLYYSNRVVTPAPAPAVAAVPAATAAPRSGPSPLLAGLFARARRAPAPAAPAQAYARAPVVVAAPIPAPAPAVAMAMPPAGAYVRAPAAMVAAVPVVAVPPAPVYTLDTGDKLRIVVFGQEGLSSSYVVDAAGNITMPLIGPVVARGLTPLQLTRTIADRLRAGFIREPHVAIEVETYRPFFILGEVTAPGQYPYVPNMTIENAVAIAGGYTPRAYRFDVKIDRPVPGGGVRSRGSVPLLTRIEPGDTVIIKERWF